MELRPYQKQAIAAVRNEWKDGHKKTLLSLPTGTGKTIVFSTIAQAAANNKRHTLILAHRDELLDQAADKLYRISGISAAKEKAELTTWTDDPLVTVGSVQSMSRQNRLEHFPHNRYDVIIVDEAHHALSDTYQTVLQYFDTAFVLGVTATPERGDKKNLAEYFDSLAYEYSMKQAIKDGYLCPVSAQLIPLNIDLTGVKISQGDYSADGLGAALDPYLEQIADEMVTACKGRKTVVFLPLIATSQHFCELLRERGMRAAEVNGKSLDRKSKLDDFEKGRYDVLCNSMLLTEGWDCPSVDCVVVLRPTTVRALYQQMVGRGMRLADGKKDLLILDFLWLTSKHNLCKPAGLFARNEDIAKKIEKKLENGEPTDLSDAEEEAESDARAERERSLATQLAMQSAKKRKSVDPMNFAFSIADDDLANYEPTFQWEMAFPTDKQLDLLEKFGFDRESIPTKGFASMLLSKLMDRRKEGYATPKQVMYLKKVGVENAQYMSFNEASEKITELSKGWIRR